MGALQIALLRCSFQLCFTSAGATWTIMFESDQHVTDCRVRKTGKPLLARAHTHTLTVNTVTLARWWMCSHPSSSSLFRMSDNIHVFWFSSVYLCFISLVLILSLPYLPPKPSSSFSIPRHPLFSRLSLALFSSLALASQSSACRDCLHLQHTWGIKEGWNSLIRGRSEKKRRAPYSTALYLWCCEILNETWGRSEHQCLISFWPTSVPRIRYLFLISSIETLFFCPPIYSCIMKNSPSKHFKNNM